LGCSYIHFFGDETCERIASHEKNLRLFRCDEFAEFVEAGTSHKFQDTFEIGLQKAIEREALCVLCSNCARSVLDLCSICGWVLRARSWVWDVEL
jgi:hypothetical protein